MTCINVVACFRAQKFANKIVIFAVLERWLLHLRETDSTFVFIIIIIHLAHKWIAQIRRNGSETGFGFEDKITPFTDILLMY